MVLTVLSREIEQFIDDVKPHVAHLKIHQYKGDIEGSGIFYVDPTSKIYVFTNEHVIEQALSIDVHTSDGNVYEGNLIGVDKLTDLAVLSINPGKNLLVEPLSYLDSSKLRLGTLVCSIGHPLGFHWSASLGIISGLNRSFPNRIGRMMHNIIQTDATSNMGSSGGPLINFDKEIIGMNTAVILGASGMNFAIASNTITHITDTLIKEREVVRGFLGIMGESALIPSDHKLLGGQALRITGIAVNGPVYMILEYEDLLLYINNYRITSMSDVHLALDKSTIGNEVTMEIIREGKPKTIKCIPEKLEL